MNQFTCEMSMTSKVQDKKATQFFENLTEAQIKDVMHKKLDAFIDNDMLIEFKLKIFRDENLPG